MLEHSEYIELKEQLINDLNSVYVRIEDCQETTSSFEKSINKDNVRLAVIEQQNKLMLWIMSAIAGGVITMLIKMFFGG